ncbi:MAG: CDGSH iron-sulfur domain-containing protein [Candidatus Rokubacteria bacterium]|nr:CDGSH iron-sulfur domain-containing protein [Candidatus Rokubacteria bacterium]
MATKVTILKDGPLMVKGQIEVLDPQGQPITTSTDTAYFCRCGASGKKPFCDGGHKKVSFQG